MSRILIVDDDSELRETLLEVIQQEGMQASSAADAESGLKKLAEADFDIVLLDLIMPKMNGIDAIPFFIKAGPKVKIVVMTAYSTIDTAVESMKKGAVDYLSKPFKINELMVTIRRIIEEQRFKDCAYELDIDCALSTMANPIRRLIMHMLDKNRSMRFMEITRTLGIEDHTKVNFHLKVLRESGYIAQSDEKAYVTTDKGEKILECLSIIEKNIK